MSGEEFEEGNMRLVLTFAYNAVKSGMSSDNKRVITLSVAKDKKEEKKKVHLTERRRVRTHRGLSRMLVAPRTPLVCLLTLPRTQRQTPACVRARLGSSARVHGARCIIYGWRSVRRRGAPRGAREGERRKL